MASKVNLDRSEKLDITCRKGDTFSLTLTLKDSAGTAIQLTTLGYVFVMQVRGRSKESGGRDLVIGSISQGPTVATGENFSFEVSDSGTVTINASSDIMGRVSPGRYVYDIQQIVDSVSTTILKGSFVVNDDISIVSNTAS